MKNVKEDTLEDQAILWFKEMGYSYHFGPDINPGVDNAARKNFSEVLLQDRLKNKLIEINPKVPIIGIDEAIRKIKLFEITNLVLQNKSCH